MEEATDIRVREMTVEELMEHCKCVKQLPMGCFHCKLGAVKTVELQGDMVTCDVECRLAPLDEVGQELLDLSADHLIIHARKMDISKEAW